MKKIDVNETVVLIESVDPIQVVEALPEKYFKKGHLPKAVNLPHDSSEQIILETLDKNDPVVVYCASTTCKNSEQLCERLLEMGFSEVYEFSEGKEGWLNAGHELVVS